MPNQDSVWHNRQQAFDRLFPYIIAILIVMAVGISYQIVKSEPKAEAGDSTSNAIIKNQIAVLDQFGARNTPGDSAQTILTKTSQGPINLRTATSTELETLKGIGEKRAADIVALRDEGKIKSVDDLQKVKGIGKKLFSEIKDELIWE